MSILMTILYAIVQGVATFLPLSGVGHLGLTTYLLNGETGQNGFVQAAIYLGLVVAVVVALRRLIKKLCLELFHTLRDIFTGKFHFHGMNEHRHLLVMLVLSSLPLSILLLFRPFYASFLMEGGLALMGVCFTLTSVVLYCSYYIEEGSKKAAGITIKDVAVISLVQAFSVFPGISQIGITSVAGMKRGLSRRTAAQFSLLLAIPMLLGEGIRSLHTAFTAKSAFLPLSVFFGFLCCAVIGYFAIRMFSYVISVGKLRIFSYYMLVLGGVTILLSILGFMK